MKKRFYFMVACLSFSFLISTGISAQVISGTYAIKNVQTGMLLRIKNASSADGAPLVSYTPANWKCMTWDFKHVNGNTYQFRNLYTGKTFQSKSATPVESVSLEQQPLNIPQANQQYDFILLEKNVYLIRATGTELYIRPADKNGSQDTGIILTSKTDNKLQHWTIYEQKPTV